MIFSTKYDILSVVMIMFFATKETIPEGMGFSTFGYVHLIWLAAILLFFVVSVGVYRKLSAEKRTVMRNVVGIIVVLLEIIKDIIAAVLGYFSVGHLPFHLCGINILLIVFDMIKPTKTVQSFLYYFCIPGAMLALLFPNWTVLPCLNFSHIHSFVIHAFLVLYPLLLVADSAVKAEIREIPKCILLLVGMAILIYFVNLLCDTNFMFLMEPETGNPLGLFEKYLGSHLWGFPVLLPIVMAIMYIPLYLITKHSKNKIK